MKHKVITESALSDMLFKSMSKFGDMMSILPIEGLSMVDDFDEEPKEFEIEICTGDDCDDTTFDELDDDFDNDTEGSDYSDNNIYTHGTY